MTTFCIALIGICAVMAALLSTNPGAQFAFAMFAAGCGVAALLTSKEQ